jgi:holo-[acyl-carrier protein] synthase
MAPPTATINTSFRVGVDVVNVDDVAWSIGHFGSRYLTRLFTEHEIDCCAASPSLMAAGIAARFAAKEAALKVLRPTDLRPEWRSIEVRRQAGGWCDLILTGEAAELALSEGVDNIAISLSHDGNVAIAMAMARVDNL